MTAGPIGFSTASFVFDPNGMSFDRYFDLNDRMERLDQLIAFAVGLTPRATHLRYLDLSRVDLSTGAGPSACLACHLASGVAATETMSVLLNRGRSRPPLSTNNSTRSSVDSSAGGSAAATAIHFSG